MRACVRVCFMIPGDGCWMNGGAGRGREESFAFVFFDSPRYPVSFLLIMNGEMREEWRSWKDDRLRLRLHVLYKDEKRGAKV